MAASPFDYVVFGNNDVTYDGFTTSVGAPVASNQNVNLGGSGNFTGLTGGGSLTAADQQSFAQTITGDVTFNGGVTIGTLSSVGGSINAGGPVMDGANVTGGITSNASVELNDSETVGQNIIANGNVTLDGTNTVSGNVGANGNVSLGIGAKVLGNVTLTGSLTVGPLASVGSSSVGSLNPAPSQFTPVAVPAGPSFSGGGSDVTMPLFDHLTLAPGHYGALTFEGSNQLTLSSGDYYFNSIQSPALFETLNLNIGSGPIRIFVAGNTQFNALNVTVNGQSFNSANSSLAAQVLLDTHGTVTMDDINPANGSHFFGTLFDPTGAIVLGVNESLVGQVIGGSTVQIGDNTNVTFVHAASGLVPEPSTLALAAMALVTVGSAVCRKEYRRS